MMSSFCVFLCEAFEMEREKKLFIYCNIKKTQTKTGKLRGKKIKKWQKYSYSDNVKKYGLTYILFYSKHPEL